MKTKLLFNKTTIVVGALFLFQTHNSIAGYCGFCISSDPTKQVNSDTIDIYAGDSAKLYALCYYSDLWCMGYDTASITWFRNGVAFDTTTMANGSFVGNTYLFVSPPQAVVLPGEYTIGSTKHPTLYCCGKIVVRIKDSIPVLPQPPADNISASQMSPNFYIPNSFTPNGDNKNDEFKPVLMSISENQYKFFIYDRWGNLVFQTANPLQGWNGKVNGGGHLAQEDAYMWRVQIVDGEKGKQEYTGRVSLIR